ncbi:hypothetical protein FRC01_011673, partial [Tulasnella sp. 417]
MVHDLGLDRENATDADVKDLKNLICARCDSNLAEYSTFAQIANHYIQAQKWYSSVKHAKRFRGHTNEVINDHDWLSNDSPLVRQHDETERASIESLQEAFRNQTITDPTCDTRGIGGEDLRLNIAERE